MFLCGFLLQYYDCHFSSVKLTGCAVVKSQVDDKNGPQKCLISIFTGLFLFSDLFCNSAQDLSLIFMVRCKHRWLAYDYVHNTQQSFIFNRCSTTEGVHARTVWISRIQLKIAPCDQK